jgi:hypothetical protein
VNRPCYESPLIYIYIYIYPTTADDYRRVEEAQMKRSMQRSNGYATHAPPNGTQDSLCIVCQSTTTMLHKHARKSAALSAPDTLRGEKT